MDRVAHAQMLERELTELADALIVWANSVKNDQTEAGPASMLLAALARQSITITRTTIELLKEN